MNSPEYSYPRQNVHESSYERGVGVYFAPCLNGRSNDSSNVLPTDVYHSFILLGTVFAKYKRAVSMAVRDTDKPVFVESNTLILQT